MSKIIIEGGRRLVGRVRVNGAKNAALPIMAAALLTADECIFENIPNIEDTRTMAELLSRLGAAVTHDAPAHRIIIQARHLARFTAPADLVQRMRASFLVTGPLLSRWGLAGAPHPGGCAIGTRPVNVDIKGFAAMGANVETRDGYYVMSASGLRGASIYLDYPSHTGTENLLLAATLAKGTTIIKHASAEPEVVCLANCLRAMGARIRGDGTSIIEAEGVESLHGVRFTVCPDRIEAGTFAVAAAITGGEVELEDVVVPHMEPVTHKLRELGVAVTADEGGYWVRAGGRLAASEVQTLPYPGFPTDLQSCVTTLLTQAHGTSLVHERIYDNRLLYVDELRKMGARISVSGQTAIVEGPQNLGGAPVRALDIRCGAALVLAGLVAEGITEISDVHHVERGYEALVPKLRSLGARIERVSIPAGAAAAV